MNVEIIKMDHQGRGIGKIDNKVVFVPYTLIGETVKIKIIENKKNYSVGEIVEIIEKSDKRIIPKCPYYFQCGGCDLMHTKYEEQLKIKENMIKDIFKRYLNSDIKINNIISGNEYNYRNKITLQVKNNIGYYQKNSYDIIEIDKCLIADDKINELINKIKKNINLKGISKIIIRCSKNTNDKMIVFDTNQSLDIDFLKNDVNSIITNKNFKVLSGTDSIIEKLNDYKIVVSKDSFFQTNTDITIKLYDEILNSGKFDTNDTVIDLYCGTGTIGIYISKYVKKVIGIEINENAVKDANENKQLNDISNVSFICGDVEKILEEKNYNPTAIIVDPPRGGLSEKTIKQIKKINSNKIIYVSCNPITLVRDLKLLADKYDIISVKPVDMFPNTHHVECVCVMELH